MFPRSLLRAELGCSAASAEVPPGVAVLAGGGGANLAAALSGAKRSHWGPILKGFP